MSDCTYRMTIKGNGDSRAAPIISKVIHFPAAELAIIIGKVTLNDTQLMAWATKFRKRQLNDRDDVDLEIAYAGKTTRKITIKEASVLGYYETYDADDGLGRFELVIQKHACADKEYFYTPVKQKDGSLKHVVYRLDTLYLDSLDKLTGVKRTKPRIDPYEEYQFGRPDLPNDSIFSDENRSAPLNISFSLISSDRETIYGQLELDLTAQSGRELLGDNRAVIQDRISQLIADGYGVKRATVDRTQNTRTVGGNTVKFHMAEWYRVSTGEKRMKVTAPRIKLAYNNVNPKETNSSGIPGLLEFVGGAAAASTAQEEATPAAEAVEKPKVNSEEPLPVRRNRLSGPVEISPPPNATPEQIAQTKAYVAGSNKALTDGALSPTGKVSTKGDLRRKASRAAQKEKQRAEKAGKPYQGHPGHVPDTTWTGDPEPHSWQDLDPIVNTSIGGQSNKYPEGYKPTKFVYKEKEHDE